jgi:alcohol dehydrogenase class IV
VMVHNKAAIAERMSLLARVLDLPGGGFDAVLKWTLDFRAALKIPHTLKEIGVDDARAAEIGTMAENDPSSGGNPCPVTAKELEAVFRAAVAGKI